MLKAKTIIIGLVLAAVLTVQPSISHAESKGNCNFSLPALIKKIKSNRLILCRDHKKFIIPTCARTKTDELERGKTKMLYFKVPGLKTYIEGYGKNGLQTINIREGKDFWAIFGVDGETGKINKIRVKGEKEFTLRSSCGKKKKML